MFSQYGREYMHGIVLNNNVPIKQHQNREEEHALLFIAYMYQAEVNLFIQDIFFTANSSFVFYFSHLHAC